MRIAIVHPNDHSDGAGIAGNWPPAWVACLTRPLRRAGFDDINFNDPMTHHLNGDALLALLADMRPDVVGATAITPAVFEAEEVLRIAAEVAPTAPAAGSRSVRVRHCSTGKRACPTPSCKV